MADPISLKNSVHTGLKGFSIEVKDVHELLLSMLLQCVVLCQEHQLHSAMSMGTILERFCGFSDRRIYFFILNLFDYSPTKPIRINIYYLINFTSGYFAICV